MASKNTWEDVVRTERMPYGRWIAASGELIVSGATEEEALRNLKELGVGVKAGNVPIEGAEQVKAGILQEVASFLAGARHGAECPNTDDPFDEQHNCTCGLQYLRVRVANAIVGKKGKADGKR